MRILVVLLALVVAFPAAAREKFLDTQVITSPGGITAWLVEDHILPIIAMKVSFQGVGTVRDPEGKQGLIRMLSNTLDEGAGDLDSQEFQKMLSDHSITLRFGAERDKFTAELETLSRHKDKAFDLMRLAVTEPRFDEDAVIRMRDANIARIRTSQSDPEWVTARIANDRIFEGHPYARNSGGTLSGLAAITATDLKDIAAKTLTQENLQISVTGDISAEELATVLDQIFGKLPQSNEETDLNDITLQNTGKTYLHKQDIPQTVISIAMPGLDRKDPDYYAAKVMNYIFGESGFGSRLMEKAREKRGLTYGIYSRLQHYKHIDVLYISTSTRNESAADMLDVIRNEMQNLQAKEVPAQELQDAKSYLIGSIPLSLTSTGKIAGMLSALQNRDLPPDYLDNYAAKINAVTAADVQRLAKKLLDPDNMTIVLVGQPEDVKPTEIIEKLPNVE